MRSSLLKLMVVLALVVLTASVPASARSGGMNAVAPAFQSIGPLAFGPDGVLYAADKQAATIFALDLGAQASGGAPGTGDVPAVDQKIAAMLGTAPAEIAITDLAVHPKTHHSYLSVMRGQGAGAQAVLVRVDGAGKIDLVSFETVKFSSVTLPNPANVNATGRGGRAESVTDLAFVNGRLFVAGLSNEEFASKLWSVPYPFTSADRGTSVEIYHTNHDAVETRSPVYAFVPYTVGNQPHLIGGYLCTPLVKFSVATLKPGEKVRGTTIAELGAGNRPIDMIVYKKDGTEFLLMSNTNRGVMKIPTAGFATAESLTSRVGGTAGVPFETVASMTGIQQLDLLNAERSIVIARTSSGGLDLRAVILP